MQAWQLLHKWHQRSDELNVISYGSTMSACEKGALPEQAMPTLRAAISTCEPCTCEKGGEPEQALREGRGAQDG